MQITTLEKYYNRVKFYNFTGHIFNLKLAAFLSVSL